MYDATPSLTRLYNYCPQRLNLWEENMKVVPAILEKNFDEIEKKISLVKDYADVVQIDICDGRFVKNTTWPFQSEDGRLKKILAEEEGLPFWEDIDYEFDLMVNNPESEIDNWVRAGARRVVLHIESAPSDKISEVIHEWKNAVDLSLAIGPATSLDNLYTYIHEINFIQLMGIERIGFQGQKFDKRVLENIKKIKRDFPNIEITVDGGVNLEIAADLKEAGADRVAVGSALFGSENVREFINLIQNT